MGPRASKNAFTMYTAIAGAAENDLKMAHFVWGFWSLLSLSKKKAPIGLKIFFLHNVAVGCPYELKFKKDWSKKSLGLSKCPLAFCEVLARWHCKSMVCECNFNYRLGLGADY